MLKTISLEKTKAFNGIVGILLIFMSISGTYFKSYNIESGLFYIFCCAIGIITALSILFYFYLESMCIIEENDELTKMIEYKSNSLTIKIVTLILLILCLVIDFLNISIVLNIYSCGIFIGAGMTIKFFVYKILSKKEISYGA